MTTGREDRTSSLVRKRSGAGEPLLLLHGVGESAAGWRPTQDALSKSFDVIVVDLPGFGDAPALPRGVLPTAAALADAIEQQLDELGLSTVHIAGYSLGARVSLELASRGRARSVVAIAPTASGLLRNGSTRRCPSWGGDSLLTCLRRSPRRSPQQVPAEPRSSAPTAVARGS